VYICNVILIPFSLVYVFLGNSLDILYARQPTQLLLCSLALPSSTHFLYTQCHLVWHMLCQTCLCHVARGPIKATLPRNAWLNMDEFQGCLCTIYMMWLRMRCADLIHMDVNGSLWMCSFRGGGFPGLAFHYKSFGGVRPQTSQPASGDFDDFGWQMYSTLYLADGIRMVHSRASGVLSLSRCSPPPYENSTDPTTFLIICWGYGIHIRLLLHFGD